LIQEEKLPQVAQQQNNLHLIQEEKQSQDRPVF
jgi:hypothetical protein